MKLREHLENNVFDYIDKQDKNKKRKIEPEPVKKYCKNYVKGTNGLCKHYIGCTVDIITCATECAKNNGK